MSEADKLRARVTYKQFKSISDAFDISKEHGLNTVYQIMDGKRAFQSARASQYAHEALGQVIKDIKNGI